MLGRFAILVMLMLDGWLTSEVDRSPARPAYAWSLLTDSAAFPGAYNFPVFTLHRQMWAFHPQGNWSSTDGKTWVRSPLPLAGLNSGYQKYVVLDDAVYALGTMKGNYLHLQLTSQIARTRDFRQWETVAAESNLPRRVFYGAVTYKNRIWLMGGFDGAGYHNDVWSSADGIRWKRATRHAGWSPRNVDLAVVFEDRMWIIGGGVIDGQREINPNSRREAWSSLDGVHWDKAPDRAGPAWGGTPAVFDGKLWLVGANRNSTFAPASLVTADGVTWREEAAPWAPRGAPAVWVFDDKLYMTGGKYSVMENGAPRFIYRNDVWQLARTHQ
ncbi:MAG: hypothetical protein M3068_04610 [Gemmatimonadota bacterium]|nr:hypothetical protein [Gemmatimonadota bacterium]